MDCRVARVFFFQAEDGIRDYKVTGVQTCALPISSRSPPLPRGRFGRPGACGSTNAVMQPARRTGAANIRCWIQESSYFLSSTIEAELNAWFQPREYRLSYRGGVRDRYRGSSSARTAIRQV